MSSQSQKSARSPSRHAERKAAAEKAQRRNRLGMFAGAIIVAASIVATLFIVSRPSQTGLPPVKAATEAYANVPENGRTMGNPGAPVKVVEWGDYQ
jgi:sugar phosphate permease